MTSPSLKELPPVPKDHTGWPWTEETAAVSKTISNGDAWPRISIVTPSYNQGRFIEQTIRSVILQGYPDLEYIIIDGGSTDGTVDIIKKYAPWLTYWVSENDRGQSHAINKGIERCTGEVFNWINSDDYLARGALALVGQIWKESAPHILAGRGITVNISDQKVKEWIPKPPASIRDFLNDYVSLFQPSTFLSMQFLKESGGVREDLNYIMDWELYLRMVMHYKGNLKVQSIPAILSCAWSHPEAKTNKHFSGFIKEGERVIGEIKSDVTIYERLLIAKCLRGSRRWQALHVDMVDKPLGPLLQFTLRYPELLLSRFYWGKMRRIITSDRGH